MLKIRLKDLHNLTGRTIQNWGADWSWLGLELALLEMTSQFGPAQVEKVCWISATPSNWVSPLGHSWSISGCSVTYHLPAGFRKTPCTTPQKMVRSSFVLARR